MCVCLILTCRNLILSVGAVIFFYRGKKWPLFIWKCKPHFQKKMMLNPVLQNHQVLSSLFSAPEFWAGGKCKYLKMEESINIIDSFVKMSFMMSFLQDSFQVFLTKGWLISWHVTVLKSFKSVNLCIEYCWFLYIPVIPVLKR